MSRRCALVTQTLNEYCGNFGTVWEFGDYEGCCDEACAGRVMLREKGLLG